MTNEEKLAEQTRSWNDFSGGWKKWDDFILDWFRSVGDKMIKNANIQPNDGVLDTATGTGEPGLTVAEANSKTKVTGTDTSEQMVAIANEKAKARGIINFTAVVGPTSKLPFENDSFDVVLSRYGVIFAPDVLADVKEIARVTKTGGRISLSAWSEPAKNPWAPIVLKIIGEVIDMPPPAPDAPGIFRCPGPDSLSSIMEQASLKNITVEELTGEMVFDTAEDYWKLMIEIAAPIVGALKGVDESVREEVRKQTLAVLNANHIRDGKVVLPWSARVVTGEK